MLCLHLQKDTRKTVLDIIINEPGITGQELSSKLGLDKSTIHWHVSELEGDKIIDFKTEGKFKKYYFANNFEINHVNRNMNK